MINRGFKMVDLKIPHGVDRVRFSCAYLFRIKVNGKYFLVKDEQGRPTFQPVGGAYKYYDTPKIFNEIEFENCNKFAIKDDLEKDLRCFIPRKNARKFAKWYKRNEERETIKDVFREFQEEVLDIVEFSNEKVFDSLECRFCGTHIDREKADSHTLQIRYADIIEIILNDEQRHEFQKLINTHSTQYRFATEDEIYKKGRIDGGCQNSTISNHSYKILPATEKDANFKKNRNSKKTYIVKNPCTDSNLPTINWNDVANYDIEKPFTFISYQRLNERSVFYFCKKYENILNNLWLDRRVVGENWHEDMIKGLNSKNCKKAILFINNQYLCHSNPCYKEAKLISEKKIPHIIVLVGLDIDDVLEIISDWSKDNNADKTKLITFKQLFGYDNDTHSINTSTYTLSNESADQIIQVIKNLEREK